VSDRESVGRVRAATGMSIILAILIAFLYQLATGEEIQPWLVLLVSVLGLAAGTALLGEKAVRTGYELFRLE
jgi:phosphate/sulfate permease